MAKIEDNSSTEKMDSTYCQVEKYTVSLSNLIVNAITGDYITGTKSYYLFAGVIYFSGPMMWEWAKLRRLSREEAEPLLSSLNVLAVEDDENIPPTGYSVYEFESPDHTIQIAAISVSELDEMPETRDKD
jgi:hypothetical protein